MEGGYARDPVWGPGALLSISFWEPTCPDLTAVPVHGDMIETPTVGALAWDGEVLDSNLTFVAHLLWDCAKVPVLFRVQPSLPRNGQLGPSDLLPLSLLP